MMRIARKLKLLAGMEALHLLLLAEAFCLMGWARFRLLRSPFVKLAGSLGEFMKETGYEERADRRREMSIIQNTLHIASRNTLWESKCLVRAVAGLMMLKRRGIESTLYLGTSKDEKGRLIAHAWLRSGPRYITGAEEMERFVEVGKFAAFPKTAAGKR